MPIGIEEYQYPKFFKPKERKPFGTDSKSKFYATLENEQFRVYHNDEGTFPQPGYNVNHNTAKIKKINVNSDNYTVPPY